MWKTEIIPFNKNVYVWIKDRRDFSRSWPIVIETKDGKTVVINYSPEVYSVDVDKKDK